LVRGAQAVRLLAHQGQARPLFQKVGVVGNPAAEIAVGDLPVVDPPIDEVADQLQVLELSEGPERHARRRRRLGEGQGPLAVVGDVGPVLPRRAVGGIDPEEVGGVGHQPGEERLALGGGVLLDQEAPVVLHLVESVGHVLGGAGRAVLEDEANLRAVQRGRVELWAA
jgi:hypothetical protein